MLLLIITQYEPVCLLQQNKIVNPSDYILIISIISE